MVDKKTIWLDLRFIKKNNHYSQFIYELAIKLIKENTNTVFNIYLSKEFKKLYFWGNSINIISPIKPGTVKDFLFFKKEIRKEDYMIFFNHKIPYNIRNNYIAFIPELIDLHFPKSEWIINKMWVNFLFNNSCKKAKKIICFNKQVRNELNDKLNIHESNIEIIPAFFNKIKEEDINLLNFDIKTKYNIKWDYIIYDSWVWVEKNLDKLIELFKKIKKENIGINLLVLDDNTISNINFRKQVLQNWLNENIFFIWNVNSHEENYFYKNTLWVIFPFLYNVFPFYMDKALNYNSTIYSSDLEPIKKIMWNNVIYFNANNTLDIYKKITNNLKSINNYSEIFEVNNNENTYNKLSKIINDTII